MIFLFFLLLSGAFWFVNATNKSRNTNIIVPIRYVDIPNDVSITNSPPQEIKVNVRDQGRNLFSYSRSRILPLNIELSDAKTAKGTIKFTPEQLHAKLGYILHPSTTILGFAPDSLIIQYEGLQSATLPVKVDLRVEPDQQYILADSVSIYPTTVDVFGTKEVLDTLKAIRTKYTELKKISEPTIINIPLIQPAGTKLSTDQIEVRVDVEMFTERKVQLPVTFLNQPAGYTLKSFPAFIDVTYNIPLSDYNTERDNITLYIDYNDIRRNNKEKQKVSIKADSPKIFNIRLSPEEVEFILEETIP
ncbi:YbbR-like domain-containing protein [Paludibacteraceae bacterium OttesenSCG-928-F17]|nr:YbbR-like domain-containing protein [Paludibacteraceae bacterium OttesenSCG-928-F17]